NLDDALRRKNELTIRAPFDGVVIGPQLADIQGAYLPRGQEIATVADTATLRIRANIEQKDAQLAIVGNADNAQARLMALRPQVRLPSDVASILTPMDAYVLPSGVDRVVDPAVAASGAGEIPVDPKDPKGMKSQDRLFEVRL